MLEELKKPLEDLKEAGKDLAHKASEKYSEPGKDFINRTRARGSDLIDKILERSTSYLGTMAIENKELTYNRDYVPAQESSAGKAGEKEEAGETENPEEKEEV